MGNLNWIGDQIPRPVANSATRTGQPRSGVPKAWASPLQERGSWLEEDEKHCPLLGEILGARAWRIEESGIVLGNSSVILSGVSAPRSEDHAESLGPEPAEGNALTRVGCPPLASSTEGSSSSRASRSAPASLCGRWQQRELGACSGPQCRDGLIVEVIGQPRKKSGVFLLLS